MYKADIFRQEATDLEVTATQEFLEEVQYFLDNYASRSESEPYQYASPDADFLQACVNTLKAKQKIPYWIGSEWGSGGYRPYTDDDARSLHDSIVTRLFNIYLNQE